MSNEKENATQRSLKSLIGDERWSLLDNGSKPGQSENHEVPGNSGITEFKLGEICSNAFASLDAPKTDHFANEAESSISFVVLNRTSMEEAQESCLADFNDIQAKTLSIDCGSISGINPEEVHQKLSELLQENARLKETLAENNEAMKRQFNSLATWQEHARTVHNDHKKKFAETRDLINQLKKENAELKIVIASSVNEESSLGFKKLENASLKKEANEGTSATDAALFKEIKAIKEMLHETKDNYMKLSQVVEKQASLSENSSLHSANESMQKSAVMNERKMCLNEIENDVSILREVFQKCGLLDSEHQVGEIVETSTHNFSDIEALNKDMRQLYNTNGKSCLENLANIIAAFKWEMVLNRLKYSKILQKKLSPEHQELLRNDSGKGLKNYRLMLLEEIKKYAQEDKNLSKIERILLDCNFLEEKLKTIEQEDSRIEEQNHEKDCEENIRSMSLEKEMFMEKSMQLSREKKSLEEKLESMSCVRTHLDEEMEQVQQERKRLNEEKISLDRQSNLYEAQEKTLRMENRALRSKCEQIEIESETKHKNEKEKMDMVIEDLRSHLKKMTEDQESELFAMKTQLEVYKTDFEDEKLAKNALLAERQNYLIQIEHLLQDNQKLQKELEGCSNTQSSSDSSSQIRPQFESRYCSICHRYTNLGEVHGWGSCQPEFD